MLTKENLPAEKEISALHLSEAEIVGKIKPHRNWNGGQIPFLLFFAKKKKEEMKRYTERKYDNLEANTYLVSRKVKWHERELSITKQLQERRIGQNDRRRSQPSKKKERIKHTHLHKKGSKCEKCQHYCSKTFIEDKIPRNLILYFRVWFGAVWVLDTLKFTM